MTMQTFAVTLLTASYGMRLSVITILAWLAQSVLGLPVLAGGAAGIMSFVGPTAGYLFSFPIAAVVVAYLIGQLANKPQRRQPQRWFYLFMIFLLGNLVCLIGGASWLVMFVGKQQAVVVGVLPFISGALLKSLLASVIFLMATRRKAC